MWVVCSGFSGADLKGLQKQKNQQHQSDFPARFERAFVFVVPWVNATLQS